MIKDSCNLMIMNSRVKLTILLNGVRIWITRNILEIGIN